LVGGRIYHIVVLPLESRHVILLVELFVGGAYRDRIG
jgi:hypothetical protein